MAKRPSQQVLNHEAKGNRAHVLFVSFVETSRFLVVTYVYYTPGIYADGVYKFRLSVRMFVR